MDTVVCVIGGKSIISASHVSLMKHFSNVKVEDKQCCLDEWYSTDFQATPGDIGSYIQSVVDDKEIFNLAWPKVDEIWYMVESMGIIDTKHELNKRLVSGYHDYWSTEHFESVTQMAVALSNCKSKLGKSILEEILTPVLIAKQEFLKHMDENMHLVNPAIKRPLKQVQEAFEKHWSWRTIREQHDYYALDFNGNISARSIVAMVQELPCVWLLQVIGDDLKQINEDAALPRYRVRQRFKQVINAVWDRVCTSLGQLPVSANVESAVEVALILLRTKTMDRGKENNWSQILPLIDRCRWRLPFHDLEQLYLGLAVSQAGIEFYGKQVISMMEHFWSIKDKSTNVNQDWTVVENWCILAEETWGVDEKDVMVRKMLEIWDSLSTVNKFNFGLKVVDYYTYIVKFEKYEIPQSVVNRCKEHVLTQDWVFTRVDSCL